MNWKEKFTKIKIGDRIVLIKRSHKCTGCSFEECQKRMNNKLVGDINSDSDQGDVLIRDVGVNCYVPMDCLRKAR